MSDIQNSGVASAWKKKTHHSSFLPELSVWYTGNHEAHLLRGHHNLEVLRECKQFPEPLCPQFPLGVTEMWSLQTAALLGTQNPSFQSSAGPEVVRAIRLSPNSVQQILVFLLLQLPFPPFLTTAPQLSSEEPFFHCLGFGCPPLANSWERDPS